MRHGVPRVTPGFGCSRLRASIFRVPVPFVAYLRVYEPLRAFDDQLAEALRRAEPIDRAEVGNRERTLWLQAQLSSRPRLLPGRSAAPGVEAKPPEVMRLAPEDVIGESPLAAGPLLCPLDLRARSAAGVASFLSDEQGPLAEVAFGADRDTLRSRAHSAMRDLTGGATHVVSSTWTVPLPWFALVDPEARQIVLAEPHDPRRLVCWRLPLADARVRAERAQRIVAETIGADGPAHVLAETVRWLDHFDEESAVELDYGGLVHLLGDEPLQADTSAADVHAIVRAMESGDSDEVTGRYQQLREFWGAMAMNQRYG